MMKFIATFAICTLLASTAPAQTTSIVQVGMATATTLAPQRWVPGSVISRDDAKIASAESGRLDFVAEVGARVKTGERIAKLDDETLRLRREEINAQVLRAEAQSTLSETQLQRLQKLEASNSIAKTQIDEARATFETNAQTAAAARAQLRQIEHDIAQTEVRAPFVGIVTERFAQRGEYLQVGASIVHLVDIDHVEARVQAPLVLANQIRSGMSVGVRASDSGEKKATVRAIVPVGDERARQFELRVTLDPTLALVGSAVEVALPETQASAQSASSANAGVTVPRDAIVVRNEGAYVMRVSGDNKAERIPITTVASSGDRVEIRGGISAGDRLVVRGAERLVPGQTVNVQVGGS